LIDGWVILRTASRQTIAVADHLAAGGLEVWVATRQFLKRTPRRPSARECREAILPSFVFARSRHAHALMILAEAPSKSCPDFTVFKANGSIPVIADSELAQLRFIEKAEAARWMRQRMKQKAPAYESGDVVRIRSGSFAGLTGTVESDDGKFAEISFGPFKVKISTFLLRNDMAQDHEIAA
jgi:transcription antitermination factor NusG